MAMTRRRKRRLAKLAGVLAVLALAAGGMWLYMHPPQAVQEDTWTDPLNATQRGLADSYDDDMKDAADLLASSKWQSAGGSVLTFADDTAKTATSGKETTVCTWALSSYDASGNSTTSKKTVTTLSALDGDNSTFTMTLTRSYVDGGLQEAQVSSSRFMGGETFTRVASETAQAVEVEDAPDAAYSLTGIGKQAAQDKIRDWAAKNAPAARKASYAGEVTVTTNAAKIAWKLDDSKATEVVLVLDAATGALTAG